MNRCATALAVVLTLFTSTSAMADPTGDTYSFGLTAFDVNGGGGTFLVTPTVVTFGSGPHTIGPSIFGNPGDFMVLNEIVNVIDADTTQYILDFESFDAAGVRTNLIADGSLAATGLPFQLSFVDIGAFNGGTDRLDPEFIPTPPFSGDFVVDAAEFFFIGTGGGLFGPGGNPFNFTLETSDPGSIAGGGGVNFGGDIATATFTGEEFAGWRVQFTVTAIPEPAAVGILAMAGLIGFGYRRRQSLESV